MVTTNGFVPVSPPLIQEFRDYRDFLRKFYFYRKSLRSGFSFRQFATMCNLKSPNYLQLVMNGDRNLSEESAIAVATAMRLTINEKNYFLALVRHENAKTDEEVRLAKREGLSALKKIVTKQITKTADEILNKWHHLVVRELVFLPDFEPSPEYVVATLKNSLKFEEAQDSLDFLLKSGSVKFNGKKWIVDESVIDTGDDIFLHTKMQKYHKEVLQFWVNNLEQMNSAHQELGLINIPINSNKVPELKQRMRQFQDEIIGWLQSEDNPNCIVQLGSYLMPITKLKDT